MAIQSVPQVSNNSNPTIIPVSLEAHLRALNEEIVFVWATKEIAEIHPRPGETRLNYMKVSDFKSAVYANRFVKHKSRRLYLAPEWIKWPDRRVVNRTVYEPGQPRITADNNINTWFPSTNIPRQGDVTLWLKYIDHMFAFDPTYRDWFLAWLAYPLQFPGTKLHTAVVFWSKETATGKSTLGYIMREIYGHHNSSQIRESDLDNKHNGWAVHKEFIEVDEMPMGTSARRRAELLKSLTTRQMLPVDLKYQNRYEIRDTLNYYYTSNHLKSLYLAPEDRRFFVHNVGDTKLSEEFFRRELGPWLKSGGFSAIHYWLLNDVDLSRPVMGGDPYSPNPAPFSPGAAAPLTKSRQEVIEAGYDDVELWVKELVDSPRSILIDDHRTIFTSAELYKIFHGQFPEVKCGPSQFTQRLNERGLLLNKGVQIRFAGERLRLYGLETQSLEVSQIKSILSQERGVVETEVETP